MNRTLEKTRIQLMWKNFVKSIYSKLISRNFHEKVSILAIHLMCVKKISSNHTKNPWWWWLISQKKNEMHCSKNVDFSVTIVITFYGTLCSYNPISRKNFNFVVGSFTQITELTVQWDMTENFSLKALVMLPPCFLDWLWFNSW